MFNWHALPRFAESFHICVSNKGQMGWDMAELEDNNNTPGLPFNLSNIARWWCSNIISSCDEIFIAFPLVWWCMRCDFGFVPLTLLTATTESGK